MLIGKVHEAEPDATRDTVVKKMNNLRSAFKKELKRVTKSQTVWCRCRRDVHTKIMLLQSTSS